MLKKSAVIVAMVISMVVGYTSPAQSATIEGGGTPAEFEGRILDLAISWGEATACVVLDKGQPAQCYRTEAELNRAHPYLVTTRRGALSAAVEGLAAVACSSSLRLYSGTIYSGSLLAITQRGSIENLSIYGFDNITSSYKVGACSASFYSLANAGGTSFASSANTWASSMPAGWDNILSSIYIY